MVVVDEEAGEGFVQETSRFFEQLTTDRTGRKEAPERDTSCTISGLAQVYLYFDMYCSFPFSFIF